MTPANITKAYCGLVQRFGVGMVHDASGFIMAIQFNLLGALPMSNAEHLYKSIARFVHTQAQSIRTN